MFDIAIVGAGPAGVASALAIENKNVAILDVGNSAVATRTVSENIYLSKEKNQDLFSNLIGDDFSGLENLYNANISPKLRAPHMRFITQKPSLKEAEVISDNFSAVMSYAIGGLANAWGAGVFEFDDFDLKEFPFKAKELQPFYKTLRAEIGISGSNEDDLAKVWGIDEQLQSPLKLSPMAQAFLQRYDKNKKHFQKNGFLVGRPRLAILTKEHNGRNSFPYLNTEFFEPNTSAIYHPGFTLEKLRTCKNINYISNKFVTHYVENKDFTEVFFIDCESKKKHSIKTKKLILAAGAIATAAIVLRSNNDFVTKLPLLDNPISFLPVIFPELLGTCVKPGCFAGAELCVYYRPEFSDRSIQASFYNLAGVMRGDLVREFPFVWNGNMWATRYLSPAIGVVQVFYPDTIRGENTLSIDPDGRILLSYVSSRNNNMEKALAGVLRCSGMISFSFLAKRPIAGSSIHYAGTLPMRKGHKYLTQANGKLAETKSIYIADAASFPELPSKNLTLTIMANAMRIAKQAAASL